MAYCMNWGWDLHWEWLILVDGVECRHLSTCHFWHRNALFLLFSLSLSFCNILLVQLLMQSVVLVQQCSDSQSWQACWCIHIWSCILQVSFLTLCQFFKIVSLAGFSFSLPQHFPGASLLGLSFCLLRLIPMLINLLTSITKGIWNSSSAKPQQIPRG